MKIPDLRSGLQKSAEAYLQKTGYKIGKAIRSYKRPQGSLKARQNAWYEGGHGAFPTK